MKNIFFLNTQEPTRVYRFISTNKVYCFDKPLKVAGDLVNQDIYITHDSRLNKGDWYLTKENFVLKQLTEIDFNSVHNFTKIVFTTNKHLIKDGVKPIPDFILEFIIKNPKCNYIPIKPALSNNGRVLFGYICSIPDIPKDLPIKKPLTTKVKKQKNKSTKPIKMVSVDKLKLLIESWQKKQENYNDLAEKQLVWLNENKLVKRGAEHSYKKLKYKALATRDCWKELQNLIK